MSRFDTNITSICTINVLPINCQKLKNCQRQVKLEIFYLKLHKFISECYQPDMYASYFCEVSEAKQHQNQVCVTVC